MSVKALAQWFGSNRMLSSHVGDSLDGCSWVGVLFAGGMSELPEIKARTILVNDLHRHVINLARVAADPASRHEMFRRLRRLSFHPDELLDAQRRCIAREAGSNHPHWPYLDSSTPLAWAVDYFVSCWMARAAKAGIDDEFNGRPCVRWKADGGNPVVRYQSAIRMLGEFGRTLRRCTFETMDALDFAARCEDIAGHGLYADPPFVGTGRRYKHNAGQTDAQEVAWHTKLRDALVRFKKDAHRLPFLRSHFDSQPVPRRRLGLESSRVAQSGQQGADARGAAGAQRSEEGAVRMTWLFMESQVEISDCGLYRYWLKRRWDKADPMVCWICLNPSTADAEQDDPTIRRVVDFSKRWGYGGIYVVNLFALRSTDPAGLQEVDDPVGPRNDVAILDCATRSQTVVCAWGACELVTARGAVTARGMSVAAVLLGKSLHCLGLTKHGHPRHPLYVAGNTELVEFGR